MTLQELMSLSKEKSVSSQFAITEERINTQIDNIRKLIAFFREYPDIFIDFIKGPDSKFKLYNYQRIILRAAMRHRYVYMTLPRGSSKSFLSMLILMLRCILYPGSEMFVTTGGETTCRIIIAELNWNPEMGIRTEGCNIAVRGNAQKVKRYNPSTRPLLFFYCLEKDEKIC